MPDYKPTLLVVDDQQMNIELIEKILEMAGYHVITVGGGEEALAILDQGIHQFQAILLDRIMPKMDGMQVLAKIKKQENVKSIPVIMLTSADSPHEIQEGIDAGVYYYLTKPIKKNVLLSVIRSALQELSNFQALQNQLHQNVRASALLESGIFRFQTLKEAEDLGTLLANGCPDPQSTVLGLMELLINAVEHGNLEITYEEKTALCEDDRWVSETARRLALPEYAEKYVNVKFERKPEGIEITITDEGKGFEWQKYMNLTVDRVFDNHGRGIAMARMLSFSSIEYRGLGNQVVCTIATP